MGYKVYDILNCPKESCEELHFIRAMVEKFVEKLCNSYVEECQKENEINTLDDKKTMKSFYDSVWGTIEVEERDVYLINCPVIQRLRGIKQLGMVNYLYSTANHTRFSHTLGVMKVASDLVEKIIKECSSIHSLNPRNDGKLLRCIRTAALFHDVGHTFFSHASEKYFNEYKDNSFYIHFQKIRSFFYKEISKRPEVAEILSLLILNTKPIRDLLVLVGVLPKQVSTDDFEKELDKIFCLIIGFPHSSEYVPFAQVLSGPIDSDKLDYLKRDSYETGVPIAVDMSRIFQKIRIVKSKNQDMSLSEDYKANHEMEKFEMGISPAAVNTIDQFALSRYMMFENVYYHQKVLTAETYLREAVYKLDKSSTGLFDDMEQVLSFTDSKLLNTDYVLCLSKKSDVKILDQDEFDEGLRILSNIEKRKLPKRVLSISGNECFINLGESKGIIDKLFKDKSFEEQRKFIKIMTQEMGLILDKLGKLGKLGKDCKEPFDIFFVSSPNVGSNELNSNLVIDKQNVVERNEIFESDNWIKSRGSQKTQNYIISNPIYRSIALIAFEKILYENYDLIVELEKVIQFNDNKQIEKYKKSLADKGYYCNKSRILVKPDILFRFKDKSNKLESKWSVFNRRCDVNNGDERISSDSIIRFVQQFYCFESELGQFDVFVAECFALLEEVELITHKTLVESLSQNFQRIIDSNNCNSEDITIFAIGNMQDSSSQLIYKLNTVIQEQRHRFQVKNIENVKPDEITKYVVFLDDAFYSGHQLKQIFSTWKAHNDTDRENHSIKLASEVVTALKDKKVYFSFVYANDANTENLIEDCNNILEFKPEVLRSKSFDKKIFETKYSVARKYFEKVGKKLIELKSKDSDGKYKEHWPENRRKTSCLGYNDAQQLVVFPWNTPTYSLTALWLSGEDSSFRWLSLFTRQDK